MIYRFPRTLIFFALTLAPLASVTLADTVRLHTGEALNGQVLEVTGASIHLSQQGKLMVLPRVAARSIDFSGSPSNAKASVAKPVVIAAGQTLRLEVLNWNPVNGNGGEVTVSLQTVSEFSIGKTQNIAAGSWVTGTLRSGAGSSGAGTLTLSSIITSQNQHILAPTPVSTPKIIQQPSQAAAASSVTFDHSSVSEGQPIAGVSWLKRGAVVEVTVLQTGPRAR